MAGAIEVTNSLVIAPDELQWRFSRAGGPGGQGVNTTDSRVQLSWDVANSPALTDVQRERLSTRLGNRLVDGVLTVTAAEYRSQKRNREAASTRLAAAVREALAPPPRTRRPTRPTRGSVERRIAGKKQRSETKRLRRSTD
ncbi:alternative ribosome rescue aminoacyl-tRNA hydrolase ArfB [Spongisporangium articulatum]|uniref:Alternative ribosome rescue aminoacyl-tRNA hydrolase ArfB n=1 Tax=Spongisporangium articulatum TaxID=3362603 RepID=A0ABW8AQF2_9ACTN